MMMIRKTSIRLLPVIFFPEVKTSDEENETDNESEVKSTM